VGQTYQVTIESYGDQLVGYLDEALLFSVRDKSFVRGRVGFYCWRNSNAHFEELQVESLEAPTVLWEPSFISFNEVSIVDQGAGGPPVWVVDSCSLKQIASITGSTGIVPSGLDLGTYALGGDARWEDVLVSVRLRSDAAGAIGIMFRYQDAGKYYRFAMNRTR